MNPYPGLTVESGQGDLVNVHFVGGDVVGWGLYQSGDDDVPELFKTSLTRWHTLFGRAMRDGSACYSLLVGDRGLFGKVGVFEETDWKLGVSCGMQ